MAAVVLNGQGPPCRHDGGVRGRHRHIHHGPMLKGLHQRSVWLVSTAWLICRDQPGSREECPSGERDSSLGSQRCGRSRQSSALHLHAVSMPVRTANSQIGRPEGLRNGTSKSLEVLRSRGWMALRTLCACMQSERTMRLRKLQVEGKEAYGVRVEGKVGRYLVS